MADEPSAGAKLYWNASWEAIVAGDGHLVTDLVGRVVPCLTVEQIKALRAARAELGLSSNALTQASLAAFDVAKTHGLTAVLACAVQSVERAAAVHIQGESGTPAWQDSLYGTAHARDAAEHVVQALVVRRYADQHLVDTLSAVWCQVFGDLPDHLRFEPVPGDCACGHPVGDVVFASEAARQIRNTVDGLRSERESQREELQKLRRLLAEHHGTHVARVAVRTMLLDAFDQAPRLGEVTRQWLEKRLGLNAELTVDCRVGTRRVARKGR